MSICNTNLPPHPPHPPHHPYHSLHPPSGHVVRQELASMIPALLLKISSHHNVLDVCAAPGSKTEQLLLLLRAATPPGEVCSGMVVANDADPVRINTLRKRYARCGSANLLVTCSRAEDLQKVIAHSQLGGGKSGAKSDGGGGKSGGVFDRIIADVPCSGDGTIRKFPHIWRLFRPRMALELHVVQLQIAVASALLLRPGGRMIYSTCSINPLEDEAVVAALLEHFQGQLVLVNTRQDGEGLLPQLVTRPGLHTWDCSPETFTKGEPDDEARAASLARLPTIRDSMHPPSQARAAQLHLEYCHRILPQDNDSGGFFVAVL
ncbi:S-adenosyl-L-methionine-dependent methyltransferase, partial [Ochromonadaceae sp. CCMP2298]